jgi:phosphoribosylformylglycinamidine synthase
MEAYGGAITGIVGIYRDPMGTGKGSKLILGTYGYCVGPRDYAKELRPHLHPRRLLDGVIEGVKDGGNKSGIPTPFGQVFFDDGYLGKCLVFVTAVGFMPAKVGNESAHLKKTSSGDLLIMSGGRVGKDGIHGVTASSEAYTEHTPAGHVQIGDPYTQKKMHDFLLEARDEGLIAFITDNGGGGLSSSIGESSRFSNGCRVDLDKVPLKYEGLDQWEIWISESQERMTIAVRPSIEGFMDLSEARRGNTIIGNMTAQVISAGLQSKTCALIQVDFLQSISLSGSSGWWLPRPSARRACLSEPKEHGSLLKDILSAPISLPKTGLRDNDHVQGGCVIKPLVGKRRDMVSDAVVMRPLLGSSRGIVITQALNPFYSEIDTYHMTAVTIDEAVRRVLAVGGDPEHIGGVDNFCWPTVIDHPEQNPDGKYKAAQLVRSNWALRDYCLGYGIPLLSGKDSMYVDGHLEGPFGERRKVSGKPTLLFTASSVIKGHNKMHHHGGQGSGRVLFMCWGDKRRTEVSIIRGWEKWACMCLVDVKDSWPIYRSLHKAVEEGLIASAHAVTGEDWQFIWPW